MKLNRKKYLIAVAVIVIAIAYLLILRASIISKYAKIYDETFTFEKDIATYLPKFTELLNNLDFEYTAQESSGGFDLIKIDAEIINNNIDTVYFFSMTCYEERNSVVYNEQKFSTGTVIMCAASNRVVYAIAPNSSHKFKTDLKRLHKSKSIRLGFHFEICERDFNPYGDTYFELKKKLAEQSRVIWGVEREILKP